MPRRLSLAAAMVIAALPSSGWGAIGSASGARAEPAARASAPPESDEERRARAQAAVAEARKAAGQGDYAEALLHFERALELRPSAGLHYNIAVCHHRLMAPLSEDDPAHERHRAAAVRAYNRYLRAAPEAEDRSDVEAMIVGLGGRPDTLDDWSIERIEPDEGLPPDLRNDETPPEAELPNAEEKEPETPTTPAQPPEASEWLPRGTVGFGIVLGIQNMGRIARSDEVESLPYLGGVLRGGAFLGSRRRLNLGGELGISVQPSATERRHVLSSFLAGATVGYGLPLGRRKRFELGSGGLIGVLAESLNHRGTTNASCPAAKARDNEVSSRAGLLVAGRLTLAFLLGERRNHELAIRLTPGVALFGPGTTTDSMVDGVDCSADDAQTAWQQFDLEGPALVMMVDVGYAPRF